MREDTYKKASSLTASWLCRLAVRGLGAGEIRGARKLAHSEAGSCTLRAPGLLSACRGRELSIGVLSEKLHIGVQRMLTCSLKGASSTFKAAPCVGTSRRPDVPTLYSALSGVGLSNAA